MCVCVCASLHALHLQNTYGLTTVYMHTTHQFVGAPGNPLPALGSSTACLCHDSIAHWSRSSFWRSISGTVAPFRSISYRSSESRNSLRFATALHHLERSLRRRKGGGRRKKRREEERRKRREEGGRRREQGEERRKRREEGGQGKGGGRGGRRKGRREQKRMHKVLTPNDYINSYVFSGFIWLLWCALRMTSLYSINDYKPSGGSQL